MTDDPWHGPRKRVPQKFGVLDLIGEPTLPELARCLTEEEGDLCAELRLQRAKIQEEKGDLGKAIQEVLYAMEFLRRFATTQTSKEWHLIEECNFGGRPDANLRLHPGSKMWIRLRCAMVQLLIGQGRLKAAKAHIQQGLEETSATQHDVCRVELLMAKVRVEVLSGRLLELQGHRHLGALAAAECCLAHARRLPMPTPSAIYARMMLVSVLEQNPSLATLQRSEDSPEALEATGGAEEEVIDASEMSLLEAAGSIIISPMAKELQKKGKDKVEQSYHQQQKMLAELVTESLQDVEKLLKILGLQMTPRNLNSYCDFGPDNHGQEAFKAPPDPPLMPAGASFRSLSPSDARQLARGQERHGTPREVQRLPLGQRRDQGATSGSEAWTSRTSPGDSARSARSALNSAWPRNGEGTAKTGGYSGYGVPSVVGPQLMDVQRHLEVIRFTVLREHAKMRERAAQAKEQLAALHRVFDENLGLQRFVLDGGIPMKVFDPFPPCETGSRKAQHLSF
eukprot:s401_g32.t1